MCALYSPARNGAGQFADGTIQQVRVRGRELAQAAHDVLVHARVHQLLLRRARLRGRVLADRLVQRPVLLLALW